ncbi:MAG TPA: lysylphosphatidylglycerol synthase transmembrane domain-containing protein [Verrucomicrobiae bacterium]|nr:lysylphosphatidylglycerol synthase transmembrane domain-containing protein [Verrucomicrobiae bacterium]
MRSNLVIRAAIGAAISIVALFLVLRGVDVGRTADVLGRANPGWIVLGAVFLSMDLTLRALRWQRLLRPIASVRYRSMLGYLLVGYLANNVLPARLGELVRSHYLGDREGISRASALGTVVVERIVDLVAVVGIASVSLLVLSVRGVVASAVLVGAAVAGLFLLALALGIVAHRLPGADRARAAVERWPQVRELASRLQGGLAVAGRPRTLAEALGVSAVAWTVAILAWAAVGQSIGVELSMAQAALLASGVALASAVPAGPSNLGTFELAAVQIGKAIGVPADSAFALGLIVHAAILVTTSVGGGVAVARLGWERPPAD